MVNEHLLPVPKTLNGGLKVTNIGAKKFRSLQKTRAHQPDFKFFHNKEINNLVKSSATSDSPLPPDIQTKKDQLARKYNFVFRDDLPPGLPPTRAVDQKIEVVKGARPPHRALFQLSPSELIATKEYLTEMLNQGKSAPKNIPMEHSSFLSDKKTSSGV